MAQTRTIGILILTTMLLYVPKGLTLHGSNNDTQGGELSIILRARSLVLGPDITLGDIGEIAIPDSSQRRILSTIKIGQAPPPGESTEISLNYVRKCLRSAGLQKYLSALKGPRTIRVVTAQREIDKVFIREAMASLFSYLSCIFI